MATSNDNAPNKFGATAIADFCESLGQDKYIFDIRNVF